MKSWSLIQSHSRSPPARWHKHHRSARTGNCFSDQWSMERLSIADERLRDAGYDVERVQKRFMPARLFKVPHALFALDAGAVRDEFR